MLAQGTPLWVVSEVLGHASVAITKDVYGHLLGGEKQAAAEAIADVLFSSRDEAPESPRRTTAEDG
jgi:integrase